MEKPSKTKAKVYDFISSGSRPSSIIHGCEKHSEITAQTAVIIPFTFQKTR
jgi:hypothetical protein